MALLDLREWPAEPKAPPSVDAAKLAAALQTLCGATLRARQAGRYARWIVQISEEMEVDPFLLAALAYRHSKCDPRIRHGHHGGLISLDWRAHAAHFRRRAYRYWVLEDGSWVAKTQPLKRFAFTPASLRRTEPSLYFAAALLRVFAQQCPAIDAPFGSVPHRHPVSHLIWGDRVPDAGAEDRILLARRQLIQYYVGKPPAPIGRLRGLPMWCPLDGVPRKVTSGLGDIRGGGHHAHRGVDFESTRGELVRAVADGQVIFAGVDLARGSARPIDPERTRRVRRSSIGRGGLMVMVEHANGAVSCYMHLEGYEVREGELVRGGQVIAAVGRTGIHHDPPHLHFELRFDRHAIDPLASLGSSVFPPSSTSRGRMIIAAQPRMWREARRRRWVGRRGRKLARRGRQRQRPRQRTTGSHRAARAAR